MSLDDLINNEGIVLQGNIKVQCWYEAEEPTVFFVGNAAEFYPEEYEDCGNIGGREITYMFAYMDEEPTLCIEIADE